MLREFHCGAETRIDLGVLDFLAAVMGAVGAARETILSAYRTPQTNAMLAARAMRRGGVGWYPRPGFIHRDSGPVRNWDLGDSGFGRLLLGGHDTPRVHEPIAVSHDGELVAARTGYPFTIKDRLAVHRLRDKAPGLSD